MKPRHVGAIYDVLHKQHTGSVALGLPSLFGNYYIAFDMVYLIVRMRNVLTTVQKRYHDHESPLFAN